MSQNIRQIYIEQFQKDTYSFDNYLLDIGKEYSKDFKYMEFISF